MILHIIWLSEHDFDTIDVKTPFCSFVARKNYNDISAYFCIFCRSQTKFTLVYKLILMIFHRICLWEYRDFNTIFVRKDQFFVILSKHLNNISYVTGTPGQVLPQLGQKAAYFLKIYYKSAENQTGGELVREVA